jgi:5-formyltetrahydrofolate cyclo-ligase
MTVDERANATALIDIRILDVLQRLSAGQVLALYAAKGSEVPTDTIDAIARELGFVVVYPRVASDRVLEFVAARPDELASGRFGLREPAGEAIAIEKVDMFVVPGVAFDREGGRLGWGRGHYDATLAMARPDAVRVGLAFECQVVEKVEREAHDAPMHVIVTEVATHVV